MKFAASPPIEQQGLMRLQPSPDYSNLRRSGKPAEVEIQYCALHNRAISISSAVEKRADTKEEVVAGIQAMGTELETLCIIRLGLFGSILRDRLEEASDVDVLVEFAPGQKTFNHFMRLADILEDRLQRRFVLVTPESLSPHIDPRILATTDYVYSSG